MTAMELLVSDFVTAHPAEAARLLERDDGAAAAALLEGLGPAVAADALQQMEPLAGAAVLERAGPAGAVALVDALPLDAAARLLRRLGATARKRVLGGLPPGRRADALQRLLEHAPGTAGALLDPLAPSVHEDVSVAEALARVRRSAVAGFDCVFVVGDEQRLTGVVTHHALLAAEPELVVGGLMTRAPASVGAHAGVEAIVTHPAWHRERALPVVDPQGRFLGAVGYATARRLEGELRGQARSADPGATAAALGEFYGLALAGLAAWLTDAVRGGTRGAGGPPP